MGPQLRGGAMAMVARGSLSGNAGGNGQSGRSRTLGSPGCQAIPAGRWDDALAAMAGARVRARAVRASPAGRFPCGRQRCEGNKTVLGPGQGRRNAASTNGLHHCRQTSWKGRPMKRVPTDRLPQRRASVPQPLERLLDLGLAVVTIASTPFKTVERGFKSREVIYIFS